MPKSNCEARRQCDEYHCARCGYTWDVKDPDPPECKPKKDPKQNGRRKLAELRKTLEG